MRIPVSIAAAILADEYNTRKRCAEALLSARRHFCQRSSVLQNIHWQSDTRHSETQYYKKSWKNLGFLKKIRSYVLAPRWTPQITTIILPNSVYWSRFSDFFKSRFLKPTRGIDVAHSVGGPSVSSSLSGVQPSAWTGWKQRCLLAHILDDFVREILVHRVQLRCFVWNCAAI